MPILTISSASRRIIWAILRNFAGVFCIQATLLATPSCGDDPKTDTRVPKSLSSKQKIEALEKKVKVQQKVLRKLVFDYWVRTEKNVRKSDSNPSDQKEYIKELAEILVHYLPLVVVKKGALTEFHNDFVNNFGDPKKYLSKD